jgi:alkanesulfonate monooxygenase SsuD/methylene tetrahydromethanopterin reductase-like flavin-dependent oxidoreductase (luciferase family)
MQLGFFTMPLHPIEKNYVQSIEEDREAIILADRWGYSEAFVGEHVTDILEPIPSTLMFLASLAYQTSQIKLGSGTVNLPNYHPAAIAAQVALLDHMLKGRFLFGIGPGGLKSDAEAFGNLDSNRTAMFVESINHILKIWTTSPPYDLKGEFWNITTGRTYLPETGQGIIRTPYQKPHPPIVATVVEPYSKGVVAAAERGWYPMSADFVHPNWMSSHWQMYAKGCANVNRKADHRDWRVALSIFVADDVETARGYATSRMGPYGYKFEHLLQRFRFNKRDWMFKESKEMPDDELTLDYVLRELVIYGTPSQVAEKILARREKTGPFGTLMYTGYDWADGQLGRRSMELMATTVLPAINAELGE